MMNTKEPKNIALGGSSAYPPTLGHLHVLETILNSGLFDQVIWIICGTRTDKSYEIDPLHRQNMTDLLVKDLHYDTSKVTLTLRYEDVNSRNTPTIDWLERIKSENPASTVTFFTGSDTTIPLTKYQGKCEIEATWDRGIEIISQWPILVIPRVGFTTESSDPYNQKFFKLTILNCAQKDISSTMIRQAIHENVPWKHLTTPAIANYITQNRLFEPNTI